MKTTRWQTKALTLFIAAATLWLATACAGDSGIQIITPSAPCGPELPLTPSKEYFTWEGAKVPRGYEKSLEAAKNPISIGIQDPEGRERFIHSMRMMARAERLRSEDERAHAILDKYEYLYQANNGWVHSDGHAFDWNASSLSTETGLAIDQFAIKVRVNVHPSMLDPSIPECLDGLPVHFHYHPDFGRRLESFP